MRILIAHSSYRIAGGEDRYVQQQIELLSTAHDIEVIRPHNRDLEGGLRTGARMLYSGTLAQHVMDVMHRFRPHIVHLHNAYPSLGPAVQVATCRLQIPLVMTVHNHRLRCPNGYMFTQGGFCQRCRHGNYVHALMNKCFPSRTQAVAYGMTLWAHRFIMKLEAGVRLFIAPSRYMLNRLEEWGLGGSRASLVPNFAWPAAVWDDGTPGAYGMYLGRMSAEKGLLSLLEALRLAGDPPFRFVGEGPLLESLSTAAKSLGLSNTVFAGRVPPKDAAALVGQARYLAMPSLCEENAPLAALEAMSAGRPLLVSDRGGLPELVDNDPSLTCPAGKAPDWAQAIRRLHVDDRLCVTAGRRALRTFRHSYSPEMHRSWLEASYARVAEPEGLPGGRQR